MTNQVGNTYTAIPAEAWPCVSAAAAKDLEQFIVNNPNVVFAERGHFAPHKRARVIVLINGDEWEGYGSTLNSAKADAMVKADGGYGNGYPSNSGFAYRASTGEFVEWGA